MVEACSVEDADPIDLYVERVAVSNQHVEETIGNMATMETVLAVAMVEETWDITQDMGTILQSTIHHRLVVIEVLNSLHFKITQSSLIGNANHFSF